MANLHLQGFLGEGGVRGGYMELHNIDPAVSKQILKLMSVSICPNVMGYSTQSCF